MRVRRCRFSAFVLRTFSQILREGCLFSASMEFHRLQSPQGNTSSSKTYCSYETTFAPTNFRTCSRQCIDPGCKRYLVLPFLFVYWKLPLIVCNSVALVIIIVCNTNFFCPGVLWHNQGRLSSDPPRLNSQTGNAVHVDKVQSSLQLLRNQASMMCWE